jgi:peptidoglycan hydrolase-like protein with peptidoglycan-binding domain
VNQPYQYFSTTDATYQNGEAALVKPYLEGKLDPRTSNIPLSDINKFINNWRGDLIDLPNPAMALPFNPYNWIRIAHRNLKAYTEKQNYRVSGILPSESLASYGAKSKNQQYITMEEQKANSRKLPSDEC